MISPTLRDRTLVLDVMRGFAVLGIFVANIPSFATTDLGGTTGTHTALSGSDLWLHTLATVLVTGKMRSILAILFGAGIWLQYRKRLEVPGDWPKGYFRRSLCLGVLGIAHGLLLWFGDILSIYAVLSVLTAALVTLEKRAIRLIVGLAAGVSALLGIMLAIVASLPTPAGSDDWLKGLGIVSAFQSGTYLDQLRVRAILYPIVFAYLVVISMTMLPLFLIGASWARDGVLAKPSAHPALRRNALLVGFGLGVPLNLLGLAQLTGNHGVSTFIDTFAGPVLAIGYLMLGATLVEKGVLKAARDLLAKVGRVALTTYLSQSLLASVVFYSWGLGLIGKVSVAQQFGIVLVVWAINVLFAHLWLRWFTIGPAEWLLRSLSERRRLAFRGA